MAFLATHQESSAGLEGQEKYSRYKGGMKYYFQYITNFGEEDMARIVQLKTKGNMKLSQYSLSIYRTGMFAYGDEFYSIALKTRQSPVRSYLFGHAIELFLMSYLMKEGYEIKKLKGKPFSHNIVKLFDETLQNGLEDHFRV